MPLNDGALISNNDKRKCPLCLNPRIPPRNDFLCANCNNNSLELIRNSCIENDSINSFARTNINTIFETCQNVEDLNKVILPPDSPGMIPQPSINAMKNLALQLLKLDILNTNLKIKNIDKTQELLIARINELNQNINNIQTILDTKHEKLDSTCSKLFERYQETSDSLNTKIYEYKFERVSQIEKQSVQFQYNNYKILKELIFTSNVSKTNSLSYISKLKGGRSSHLLFHSKAIPNISDFFNYNNKLQHINEFLENLIKLQIHLQEIFNKDSVRLPYLKELMNYLPDSKFYDMIQEKENFMMNGGKLSSEEIDQDNEKEKVSLPHIKDDNNERVIKLGNTIKLPLSSKTINSQLRRASLNKEETPPPPKPKEVKNITHKEDLSPIRSTISGKKMVILPHKILTKPFTKLTAKEYLKFLLVIVKIIFNFKAFFYYTIDCIPAAQSSSSVLSNKLHDSKNSQNRTTLMNFEKILEKIATMDSYFKYKLDKLHYLKLPNSKHDMIISGILESKAGTFTSLKFQVTSTSDLASCSHTSNTNLTQSLHKKNSFNNSNSNSDVPNKNRRLKHIYSDHFKDSVHKLNDREIYGNFSESKDTLNLLLYTFDDDDNDSFNESELKSIMQNVYKLMASGTSRRHKNLKFDKSKNLDFNTTNLIAQSKVQLDDWDVVSKMYSRS